MVDMLNILIADEDPGPANLLKESCASIDGIQILGIARSKDMLMARINNVVPAVDYPWSPFPTHRTLKL